MLVTNIYDTKTNLSRYIEQVINGKEIVIAKAGRPVAMLVAYIPQKQKRKPGIFKGKIVVPDDFNSESETVNRLFDQSSLHP